MRPDHAPSAIVTAPVAVIVAAASVMMHVVAVATMMDVSDSDSMMRLVLQVHAHVHARDGAHISGLLALFLELVLDTMVVMRTAPTHSWANPVERVMSVLNLGLQGVALSREVMDEEFEI